MNDQPFVARREARWYYATECLRHVEETNCALGCRRGLIDGQAFADYGPGGTCEILARIVLEDPIPEITDLGDRLVCTAREPL